MGDNLLNTPTAPMSLGYAKLGGYFFMQKTPKKGTLSLREQLIKASQEGKIPATPPQKKTYNKPSRSVSEQLEIWRSRGLTILDDDKALHYLQFIGYYRLSGYARIFTDHSNSNFIKNVKFDDILKLYIFDRELRLIIMDVIERIEIATRAIISNTMSQTHNPHWFMDSSIFKKQDSHDEMMAKVKKSVHGKSKDELMVRHYFDNFSSPGLPPGWVISELMPIGFWSKTYENIKANADKATIAKHFGLKPPVMQSFLHCLSALRNHCAHHSRIWNRSFSITPLKVFGYEEVFRRNNTLYAQLAVLNFFMTAIADGSDWKNRLAQLLNEYPKISLVSMGIPEGWINNTFWQSQ